MLHEASAKNKPDMVDMLLHDANHEKETVPRQGEEDLQVSMGEKNSSSGSRPRGKTAKRDTDTASEQLAAQGAEVSASMRSLVKIMQPKTVKTDIMVKNTGQWLGMSLALTTSRHDVVSQCIKYLGNNQKQPEDIEAILFQPPGAVYPHIITEVRQLAEAGSTVTVRFENRDGKIYLLFE